MAPSGHYWLSGFRKTLGIIVLKWSALTVRSLFMVSLPVLLCVLRFCASCIPVIPTVSARNSSSLDIQAELLFFSFPSWITHHQPLLDFFVTAFCLDLDFSLPVSAYCCFCPRPCFTFQGNTFCCFDLCNSPNILSGSTTVINGRLQDTHRPLRVQSNAFWFDQCTCYVPGSSQ